MRDTKLLHDIQRLDAGRLTAGEVRDRLGIKPDLLRQWVHRGVIPVRAKRSGMSFYSPLDIIAAVAQRTIKRRTTE